MSSSIPIDSRTAFAKPPLSVEAQGGRIIDRGLVCEPAALEGVLSRVSYYRLSGYLWWFQASSAAHDLRPGTTLEDVLALYDFDLKLREIMLEVVHVVEVWFRSHFTNILSMAHGPMAYVDQRYFASPSALQNDKAKLMQRLKPTAAKARSEPFIERFYEKHTDLYPPMWMSVEVMSLGLVSLWFDNLRVDSIRKSIARPTGLQANVLASYLRQLTVIRNACAHHSRLWNRSFGTGIMMVKGGDPRLLEAVNGSDENRIFRALAYSAHVVSRIEPDSDLPARLKSLLLSGRDEWIIEMDAPNDFELDDLWA